MDSDDEMSVDLKHDILLGFNLFKNEKNQRNINCRSSYWMYEYRKAI